MRPYLFFRGDQCLSEDLEHLKIPLDEEGSSNSRGPRKNAWLHCSRAEWKARWVNDNRLALWKTVQPHQSVRMKQIRNFHPPGLSGC